MPARSTGFDGKPVDAFHAACRNSHLHHFSETSLRGRVVRLDEFPWSPSWRHRRRLCACPTHSTRGAFSSEWRHGRRHAGNSIKDARGFGNGVDWSQVWSVLSPLLFSPIIGFVLALIVFRLLKLAIYDRRLYKPPEHRNSSVWFRRLILSLLAKRRVVVAISDRWGR